MGETNYDDEQVVGLLARLDRLEMAIFGDPSVNAIGLMKRVSELEDIVKRWQQTELMIRGALIVLSLSTVANVAAVIKLILG